MGSEQPEEDRVYTRTCDGPVYFADQGIEVCETCGGCICCDHYEVDHRKARYRCWVSREGECLLVDSTIDHDCVRDGR